MSRSYKKHPWSGDSKGKSKKRVANHAVRTWCKEHPDVPLRGSAYKKLFESWDICDYGGLCSWEEFWRGSIRAWERWGRQYGRPYPNEKEEYRDWYKSCKGK